MEIDNRKLVDQVVKGDIKGAEILVNYLTPIIKNEVRRLLIRRRALQGPFSNNQDVADLCQEVLLLLFRDQERLLRCWNKDKGLDLEGFVSLVTRRRVVSLLRSNKFRYKQDEPLDEHEYTIGLGQNPVEKLIEDQKMLDFTFRKLRKSLSTLGYRIFVQLYVLEKTPEEIARHMKITKNTVYVWRTRIRCQARLKNNNEENDRVA